MTVPAREHLERKRRREREDEPPAARLPPVVGNAVIARLARSGPASEQAAALLGVLGAGNHVVARWANSGAVTDPDAAIERDADRRAAQALRSADPGRSPAPEARTGQDQVMRRMEASFGERFDDVRVHDSEASYTLARSLNARAVTIGTDIFFDRAQYEPGQPSGDALLAHELAHVLQHRDGELAAGTAGRWAYLGKESWHVAGWSPHEMKVWTGTEAEWRGELDEADDDETYADSLQGFLRAATEPGLIGKTSHPLGVADYYNDIKRQPTQGEVMEFLKALYGLGKDLDLTPNWLWGSGTHLRMMRGELRQFVAKYQGDLIRLISTQGVDGSKVIDQGGVAAVAEESGKDVRVAMVNGAITTAVEGAASLIRAHATGDEAAKSSAYSVIGNAGLVIRSTLDVHEAAVKFEGEVNMFLIDLALDVTKLDEIPGVQTLLRRTPAVKGLLKSTVKKMGASAASSDDPMKQAAAIAADFENDLKALGPAAGTDSVLDANTERLAITTFAAALSKK